MTLLKDFNLDAYDFDLPPELIAQRPISPRDHSRLLVYHKESQEIIHTYFYHLDQYLPPQTLLVFNNTKVFAARFFAHKGSGGRVEILFLTPQENTEGLYPALLKSRGKKKLGDRYVLPQGNSLILKKIGEGGVFYLQPEGSFSLKNNLNAQVPIPPYIRDGKSDARDLQDYQTLYAQELGSVAAPTAGLHFTPRVFESLKEKKISQCQVTLHVGAGTFSPIKSSDIRAHKMHQELFTLGPESAAHHKNSSQKVIAVGTTSLRAWESWRENYHVGDFYPTEAYFYPQHPPEKVQRILTNFHLPKSSLLLLIASLIGRKELLRVYEEAINKSYRFYSYGDAMLII